MTMHVPHLATYSLCIMGIIYVYLILYFSKEKLIGARISFLYRVCYIMYHLLYILFVIQNK